MKSGFAFVDSSAGGSLDLVLSDVDALCDSVTQKKIHAGETIVQLYTLKGTAPGTYTAENNDIKYATVSPSCPSGQPLGETNVAGAGRIQTSAITVSSLTATVAEGTLDLTFTDGSKVSGTFSVPICGSTLPESSVCY
jgi:hypothetical protein